MAVGVECRTQKVPSIASSLHHALLLQPIAMSFTPLAQTSEVAFPIPETTTFQDPDDHSEYNPAPPSHAAGQSPPQQLSKKRRQSKDKTATAIRRSSSTPHMHNIALGNAGELSPTDKRRNKLGYHRTSVACGHCRRRKIRCLVAQDEPTGRCANCIRLKKECNFYPVEQNPENPRQQGSSAKETASGPADSATSSPQHAPSLSGEKTDELRPSFASAVLPNPTSRRYRAPNDSDMEPLHASHPHALHMPQPSYGYPHAIDTQTQWPPAPSFISSSSVAESPSSSSGYNMSGGHTPATMSSTSTMSYGAHPDGHNWPPPPNFQPPTRSMSYGNIEGLPQQFPGQNLGVQQHDYPRRTSPYPYPCTIDTDPSILHTTLGSSSSAPLSAPIVSTHQYTYAPPWLPYSNGHTPGHDMPVPNRTMSGQWFGEPGHLDQVQEESAPPVGYSDHGLPEYYSGP
ncbi:hypothetical protein P280DRAFT_203222 [Massarina eburnea CBS 473.64]|uniref:Zn(2)-C6 fungal-type domain-containing protein n=1 Tax=Massarina eburnea CBS 473.64 TaxID=1395130 RepID=A0A6A6RKN9_9PLEO|nr:hypothetical protein P280DRAFT_203222 [Massarina eburnea CBS 473.64]